VVDIEAGVFALNAKGAVRETVASVRMCPADVDDRVVLIGAFHGTGPRESPLVKQHERQLSLRKEQWGDDSPCL
jgi:hypothetical protein